LEIVQKGPAVPALTAPAGLTVPPPCAPSRPLPATHESYKWLHDAVALPAMRFSKDLATGYQRFKEANDLHILVHKRPSPEALYHMACCLSLGAERCIMSKGCDVVPRLPPAGSCAASQVAELRIELALATLVQALDAGYAEASTMLVDPDIRAVRDRRQAQMALLAKRAQANSAMRAVLPKGASLAQTVPSLQANAAAQARMIPGQPQLARISSHGSQSGLALRQASFGSVGSGSSVVAVPTTPAKIIGIHTLPSRTDSLDSAPRRLLVQASPMARPAAAANAPAVGLAGEAVQASRAGPARSIHADKTESRQE